MTDNFYREEIMEHYKNPNNKGSLKDPKTHVYQVNPLCGDEINLDLRIENGVVTDIAFDGSACAVSVVASSFLTEHAKGKNINDLKSLTKAKFLELLDLNLSTSRIKCATLIFDALNQGIDKYEKSYK